MNRLFRIVVMTVFVLLGTCLANAQQSPIIQSQTFPIVTSGAVPGAQSSVYENSNFNYRILSWTATTLSTCTIEIDSSTNGTTWTSPATGTTAQTCTTSGSIAYSTLTAAYTRFNITALTATSGSLAVVYQVSQNAPTSPSLTDNYFFVPPSACSLSTTGTGTLTNALTNVGASLVTVNQISSSTGSAVVTVSCNVQVPTRTTSGKGVTITSVTLIYGNTTGTGSACGTPTLGTIALPTPALTETPSTVTPVTTGGTLTVVPAVGSCNNGTAITAGSFYSESITLATPVNLNGGTASTLTSLILDQTFSGPSSAAYTFYIGGLFVNYNNTPL